MNRARIFSLAAAILILFSIAACSIQAGEPLEPQGSVSPPSNTSTPPDGGSPAPGAVTAQMVDFNITSDLKDAYEIEFAEFDLGAMTYEASSGRMMPYKLRGIIGVPAGDGPFPVVFITHGSHENINETKRFDTGYDYLVKALARNGYIAVSMDMLMPYIWKYGDGDDAEKSAAIAGEHIKSLFMAGDGEELYPVGLTGKVDTRKIALIGHSRGGETIFRIAAEQREKGINIETLLSVAPAWDTIREFPDASCAILVPQYDGDVARLDGIALFDYLTEQNEGDYSVTFLMGANHNFFNRNIEKNDSLSGETENGYPPLTRETQEDFLINFAVDFLNTSFGIEDRFYQMSEPHPNTMYGQDISRRVHLRGAEKLIDAGTADSFSNGTASVKHMVDSYFFKEDEVLIDTVTIGMLDEDFNPVSLNRNLIQIEWSGNGSSVAVKPLISDFSGKTALCVGIVPDSASGLNSKGEALRFSVALKDTDGNAAAAVTSAGQTVLSCYPGELAETVISDEVYHYWKPAAPPGLLCIPLQVFEGVNLAAIESVELLFDQSYAGAVFICSMLIQ